LVQLTHQPTNILNKIHFISNIKLVHVSAPGGAILMEVLERRNTSPTR